MSLKQTHNYDSPVFDQPPNTPASGFFIRRLMSLAGKPLLAEKNLPIRPSNDSLAEKCYVNRAYRLYQPQHTIRAGRRFKPAVAKDKALPAMFAERESDSNMRKLSAVASKMHTADQNRLTILSANEPAVPIKSYRHAQFASKSGPFQHYDFEMPIFHPKLLGTYTNLRSIMFIEHAKNITRPSQLSRFKPRSNRQPEEFIYHDFQAIFSAKFVIDDEDFLPHLPARNYLALDPGNYGFLPAPKTYNYGLALSTEPVRFKIRNSHQNYRFDIRPDFARNLILECKTSLQAVPGNITTENPMQKSLLQSWIPVKRHLNQHTVTISLPPTLFAKAEFRFCSMPWIHADSSRNLCVITGADISAKAVRPDVIPPFLTPAFSSARSRMRLKLTLKRANFTQPESRLHFCQLLPRHNLSLKTTATKRLVASYSPLEKKKWQGVLQHSPLPDVRTNNVYAARRSTMKFVVTRHVRYCRKTLANYMTERQFPAKAAAKGLTRLFFPVPGTIHKHREYFAAGNLKHTPIKAIYLRPMPFIMRLSAMGLTDIFLPEARRRALPAATRFLADHSRRQPRQHNRLKSLRFRLFRVDGELSQLPLRAPRYIVSPDASFKILDPSEKIQTALPSSHTTLPTSRHYIPGYRGRLEKFFLSDCVPAEIARQMHLSMKICGLSNVYALDQRHFINPPEWNSTKKPFTCKIRLSPHPFGFPDFKQPVEKFNLSESTISFAYLLLNKINIKLIDTFSPTREKVFLPPLSLKNPRRFLLKDSLVGKLQHILFTEADESLSGTIKVLAKISSFNHEWGMHKHRTLRPVMADRPLSSRIRLRHIDNFTDKTDKDSYQLIPPPVHQPVFFMPQVKRLLLHCEKYFATSHKVVRQAVAQVAVQRPDPKFYNSLSLSNVRSFIWPTCDFFFNEPHNLKFFSESHCQEKCVSTDLNFKHRPRTYRFPYQPVHKTPETIETYKAFDEPLADRLTFFDQIDIDSFISFARLDAMQPSDLKAQIGTGKKTEYSRMGNSVVEHSSVNYCEPEFALESRLDYEKTGFLQQISEKKFSRLADFAKFKLRKFKYIESQMHGYLEPDITLPVRNFHEHSGSQGPARLYFDNLHWIILLRNFIELTISVPSYEYENNMAAAPKQAFSTVKSSFTNAFADKVSSNKISNLQPAAAIEHHTMPKLLIHHINIDESDFYFWRSPGAQPYIAHASQVAEKFECSDSGVELTMTIPERPEYKRHIQLYILYMAMNNNGYDYYTEISEKPLVSGAFEFATGKDGFHHPDLPDWLDLPQILAKRTSMSI